MNQQTDRAKPMSDMEYQALLDEFGMTGEELQEYFDLLNEPVGRYE